MPLIRIVEPTAEPLTREEVKQHLRIESTEEDILIDGFIKVARSEAESYMRRQIMPAKWRLTLQSFPSSTGALCLPKPPLSSEASAVEVHFYKNTMSSADDTTWPSSEYIVDRNSAISMIYPAPGYSYPSCVTTERQDAVRIEFWSGYANRHEVPEPIKLWMKMKIGQYYEHREAFSIKEYNPNRLEHEFFNGLLDPFVIVKI